MLTLKAAGLLDLDAGEIVRPGVLRIDGERIAGVGAARDAGPARDAGAAAMPALPVMPAGRRTARSSTWAS